MSTDENELSFMRNGRSTVNRENGCEKAIGSAKSIST